MAAPKSVKKLALELSELGIDSQYLARVSARVSPEQRLESIEVELAQEIAGALGRSEDRLNLALAELELCRARYDRAQLMAAAVSERDALADAYDARRAIAQQRLRELLIHREAVGFRRNQILNELYPMPGKLRR